MIIVCIVSARLSGAVVLWIMAGLIAAFGDWRQLLAAVELGAGALTLLWVAHRSVVALKLGVFPNGLFWLKTKSSPTTASSTEDSPRNSAMRRVCYIAPELSDYITFRPKRDQTWR